MELCLISCIGAKANSVFLKGKGALQREWGNGGIFT